MHTLFLWDEQCRLENDDTSSMEKYTLIAKVKIPNVDGGNGRRSGG